MGVPFHIGLLPDRPIAELARISAMAEELGFDGVWIADSQSIFRDAYAALTLVAERTDRLLLATGVTNPLTRHPAVMAGSFATLDEISGGRAVIGIGVGESAIHTIGRRPARLADLEAYIEAVRGLLSGEATFWDGREIRMTWTEQSVPVWMASSGPRSLTLGGRIADGVLFQVGAEPALTRYAVEHVHAGAADAGREGADVALLARLACSVDADRELARDRIAGYVTAAAGTVFSSVPSETLPDELRADLTRMKEGYDYYEHTSDEARHRDLLTDRIIDAIGIAGTPEEALPRFEQLLAAGAEGFVVPITGEDPEASMRTLAEQILPEL